MANPAPITGTGIAVTTPVQDTRRVFYQVSTGNIEQNDDATGVWIDDDTTPQPVLLSSIATVTSKDGTVYMFSFASDYTVQEYQSKDSGKTWTLGTLSKQAIKAVPGSGLAAVVYTDIRNFENIVVFCQYETAVGTRAIRQFANIACAGWNANDVPTTADPLGGTALAAVAHNLDAKTLRVNLYYQGQDLSVKEVIYSYENNTWGPGTIDGSAAGRSPLGAVTYSNSEIQVYWRSPNGDTVFARYYSGSWRRAVGIDGVAPGYQFTVSELDDGKKLGLYYQTFGGTIREYLSSDGGKTWSTGARLT